MNDLSSSAHSDVLMEQERRILKERAIELAREVTSGAALDSLLEVVAFELAEEQYAFPLTEVREVCEFKELTPVPCTPSFVSGIINLRGEVVTVVDIRRFFELPVQGMANRNRIIIIHSGETQLGILADAICGAKAIPLENLQLSLPTLTGIRADYLRGMTADRLIILDAAKMLSDPRLIVYETVEG